MRNDKNKAILLRKQGKSYNEIVKILGISKSTLSLWLRNIKMPVDIKRRFWNKARKKWAANIIKFNKERGKIAKQKAQQIQKLALRDVKKISKRELFLVGIALYWAEGFKKSRWAVVFSNSDPLMIRLMMRFFREICRIKENKFRAIVQIHPNVTSQKAINYWSKITKISKKQFQKTYSRLTPSSKRKRAFNVLPYGTLRISISDVRIINKIKGWIMGLEKFV
jgi:transcriptional regulator with XRE-family HTH domain